MEIAKFCFFEMYEENVLPSSFLFSAKPTRTDEKPSLSKEWGCDLSPGDGPDARVVNPAQGPASLAQWLKLYCVADSLEGLGKLVGLYLQGFWFSRSGVGLTLYTWNKFPADGDAAGPGTTVWGPLSSCLSHDYTWKYIISSYNTLLESSGFFYLLMPHIIPFWG